MSRNQCKTFSFVDGTIQTNSLTSLPPRQSRWANSSSSIQVSQQHITQHRLSSLSASRSHCLAQFPPVLTSICHKQMSHLSYWDYMYSIFTNALELHTSRVVNHIAVTTLLWCPLYIATCKNMQPTNALFSEG